MTFIKKIKQITKKSKKTKPKITLERIYKEIECAAKEGKTSVGIKSALYINSKSRLTNIEKGVVIGTLKRQGFKIKSGFDSELNAFIYDFIVSWK